MILEKPVILQVPYYKQKSHSSACGPTSLKMIFELYGKNYSEEDLINECETIKGKGTSHDKLKEISVKNGFKIITGNGNLNQIIEFINKGFPVIVNYINPLSKRGHYSIIKGYILSEKSKKLIFSDPSNGPDFEMHMDEFENSWHNSKNNSKHWFLVIKP